MGSAALIDNHAFNNRSKGVFVGSSRNVVVRNLAIFPFLPNYLLTSFIPQDKVPSATPAVSSAVVLDNKSNIVETLIYIIRSISI